MDFTESGISEFIRKGRRYITWRTGINFDNVIRYFGYDIPLYKLYPGVNISYCRPDCSHYVYDIARGGYETGLRYIIGGETYYIFIGAGSVEYNHVESIAIGKAENGKIYLIFELNPKYEEYKERITVISEDYFYRKQKGFVPRGYYHTIEAYPSMDIRQDKKITPQDIQYLKIAYKGVRAFKKLIKQVSF